MRDRTERREIGLVTEEDAQEVFVDGPKEVQESPDTAESARELTIDRLLLERREAAESEDAALLRQRLVSRLEGVDPSLLGSVLETLDAKDLWRTEILWDRIAARRLEQMNELRGLSTELEKRLEELAKVGSQDVHLKELGSLFSAERLSAKEKFILTIPLIPFFLKFQFEVAAKQRLRELWDFLNRDLW